MRRRAPQASGGPVRPPGTWLHTIPRRPGVRAAEAGASDGYFDHVRPELAALVPERRAAHRSTSAAAAARSARTSRRARAPRSSASSCSTTPRPSPSERLDHVVRADLDALEELPIEEGSRRRRGLRRRPRAPARPAPPPARRPALPQAVRPDRLLDPQRQALHRRRPAARRRPLRVHGRRPARPHARAPLHARGDRPDAARDGLRGRHRSARRTSARCPSATARWPSWRAASARTRARRPRGSRRISTSWSPGPSRGVEATARATDAQVIRRAAATSSARQALRRVHGGDEVRDVRGLREEAVERRARARRSASPCGARRTRSCRPCAAPSST